ncbi:Pycsar system effector family protein [Algoriphagus namhaensis]|uniref:Pycsar system effector family protein n=1 Tax=Algoriphagus namhaensis TaxID=915353 RepID=A0ABV8AUI6_9BACT
MENTDPVKKKKSKSDKTSRERQTFYRVAFSNNAQLLKIADNKANIIISINALVISSMIALVGYGSLSNDIDMTDAFTFVPMILFLVMSLSSTIIAVQAAKPKILGKNQLNAQVKRSVIFFGSVSTFTKDEYLDEITKTLKSRSDIQEQMSTSLYYQSMVLNQKYKLLRRAYQVFSMGLVVGVSAFLIQLLS